MHSRCRIGRVSERFLSRRTPSSRSNSQGAADSIANNIVEGCAAATRKEFARYLDIGIKSTSEVEYPLQSARDIDLLPRGTCRLLTMEVREIPMMLFGLRRVVLAADAKEQRNGEQTD